MNDTRTFYCEGDLECPNQITLSKDQVVGIREENRCILCPTCEPRYGHLTQKQNLELGWNDLR